MRGDWQGGAAFLSSTLCRDASNPAWKSTFIDPAGDGGQSFCPTCWLLHKVCSGSRMAIQHASHPDACFGMPSRPYRPYRQAKEASCDAVPSTRLTQTRKREANGITSQPTKAIAQPQTREHGEHNTTPSRFSLERRNRLFPKDNDSIITHGWDKMAIPA